MGVESMNIILNAEPILFNLMLSILLTVLIEILAIYKSKNKM